MICSEKNDKNPQSLKLFSFQNGVLSRATRKDHSHHFAVGPEASPHPGTPRDSNAYHVL